MPFARPENGSRFVAFAFAASEMMLEADRFGAITYATGAFRSRLGQEPDAFVGRPVADLIAPSDRDVLRLALLSLEERGRLLPCIVHLANSGRSAAVLAGLRLVPGRADSPMCLTLGLPPTEPVPAGQPVAAFRLMEAAQDRLRLPKPGHLALLEMTGYRDGEETLAVALERLAPATLASEVAPGRYGLLNTGDVDLQQVLPLLESILQNQGEQVTVCSRHVSLETEGLTHAQAGRALGQALAIFARAGTAGVDRAGLSGGLASYVRGAMSQAAVLRKAIARRDFTIVYQPIAALATRTVHHYEALLRPLNTMAERTPQEFVTLIEAVGLAEELDAAVAEITLEAADRCSLSLAMNVSGYSMQSPAFRDRFLALLRSSRAVRQGRFLVEMTETAQLDDLTEPSETARQLRAMGVRFCLDDFGSGAADLRVLRAVPADIVKLDGSFVPGILEGGRERAFVAGLVEIARAAGASIVAERVETEAEAEALMAAGARFGQGWLFGRPGPLPSPTPPRTARRRTGTDEEWG